MTQEIKNSIDGRVALADIQAGAKFWLINAGWSEDAILGYRTTRATVMEVPSNFTAESVFIRFSELQNITAFKIVDGVIENLYRTSIEALSSMVKICERDAEKIENTKPRVSPLKPHEAIYKLTEGQTIDPSESSLQYKDKAVSEDKKSHTPEHKHSEEDSKETEALSKYGSAPVYYVRGSIRQHQDEIKEFFCGSAECFVLITHYEDVFTINYMRVFLNGEIDVIESDIISSSRIFEEIKKFTNKPILSLPQIIRFADSENKAIFSESSDFNPFEGNSQKKLNCLFEFYHRALNSSVNLTEFLEKIKAEHGQCMIPNPCVYFSSPGVYFTGPCENVSENNAISHFSLVKTENKKFILNLILSPEYVIHCATFQTLEEVTDLFNSPVGASFPIHVSQCAIDGFQGNSAYPWKVTANTQNQLVNGEEISPENFNFDWFIFDPVFPDENPDYQEIVSYFNRIFSFWGIKKAVCAFMATVNGKETYRYFVYQASSNQIKVVELIPAGSLKYVSNNPALFPLCLLYDFISKAESLSNSSYKVLFEHLGNLSESNQEENSQSKNEIAFTVPVQYYYRPGGHKEEICDDESFKGK